MLASDVRNTFRLAILACLAFASSVSGQTLPVQSGRTADTPSGEEGQRITRNNPVTETVQTLRANTRLNTRQDTRLDQRIDRDLSASNDVESEVSSSYRKKQVVKGDRSARVVPATSVRDD